MLTLILQYFFVLKMSAFYICCIYSNALQTKFENGIKHYEPRPKGVFVLLKEQSDLGPYCLQFKLGVQWLSGRVLDSRLRGGGFESHRRGP